MANHRGATTIHTSGNNENNGIHTCGHTSGNKLETEHYVLTADSLQSAHNVLFSSLFAS